MFQVCFLIFVSQNEIETSVSYCVNIFELSKILS